MGYWAYQKFADNNPTKTTSIITTSSEDSNYPATNLALSRVSATWRSTNVVLEKILVDQGSALPVTWAGLANHNISSAATITFRMGSLSDPDGSEFSTTFTWREKNMFKTFAQQTYRYMSYRIQDPTNTAGYIEVGVPLGGLLTQPSTLQIHYEPEFIDEFANLTSPTRFGVPNVQALYDRIRFRMSFGPLSSADDTTLRALYRAQKGNLYPLFLIPDRDVNDGYYGRFVNNPLRRRLGKWVYTDIEFEEDSRGRIIAA